MNIGQFYGVIWKVKGEVLFHKFTVYLAPCSRQPTLTYVRNSSRAQPSLWWPSLNMTHSSERISPILLLTKARWRIWPPTISSRSNDVTTGSLHWLSDGWRQLASCHRGVRAKFTSYRRLIINDNWLQMILQLTQVPVPWTTAQKMNTLSGESATVGLCQLRLPELKSGNNVTFLILLRHFKELIHHTTLTKTSKVTNHHLVTTHRRFGSCWKQTSAHHLLQSFACRSCTQWPPKPIICKADTCISCITKFCL